MNIKGVIISAVRCLGAAKCYSQTMATTKKLLIVPFFAVLMIAALLFGCTSNNASPVDRANKLLAKRNLMTVQHLDSVFGYKDAHSCMMAAHNLQWKADSILEYHQSSHTLLTPDEKKEALELGQTVYNLKMETAKNELRHGLAKDKKVFLGYSVFIADSVTGSMMNVYFDKEVTKIAAIERK